MSLSSIDWRRYKEGESFFVPALDVWEVKRQVLRLGHEQLGVKHPLTGTPCVYKGQLGVMFKKFKRY